MALQAVQLHRETFSCSICLDLLRDPVTTPCGHSYCTSCLKAHWDGEDEKRIHSCPQCRQTFTPRPVLLKNIMLADLVEELKKTGLQDAPADHCYAGPEDVACDVCTGRKLKAFKSCLVCLVSFCEKHLQPHYESPAFKKHKLVEPSTTLQEKPGSPHEVMKMSRRTDQQCVRNNPSSEDDELKGHDIVSTTGRLPDLQVGGLDIQQEIQGEDVSLPQTETESRAEFLRYSRDIKLDPNTAHRYILLSQRNRKAALTNAECYPHPDRFTTCTQVLSKESLTGRCYWEVKCRGRGIHIAVAYKDISRTGESEVPGFGQNKKSWALFCGDDGYMVFWYNGEITEVPLLGPWSCRIGVYLDHGAGILSFYNVSTTHQTLTLLHRVQTTFIQPLHAGLWLDDFYDSAEFCKLK